MVGMVVFVILLLLAVVGPLFNGTDPLSMEVIARYQPPQAAHLLGTDEYGRDVLVRLLYGSRVSLGLAFVVTLMSSIVGTLLGLYAASNRFLDQLLMRICDGLCAIPGILLAIALMAALGSSLSNAFLALSIVYTPSVARIVRSAALGAFVSPSIEALRMQGAKMTRIIWLHVAPQVVAPLIVQAAFIFAEAILAEAALSFLGIGVAPPAASWGNMIYAGKTVIAAAWWLTAFPGLMIAASVLSLQLMGDGLRDLLDPRLQQVERPGWTFKIPPGKASGQAPRDAEAVTMARSGWGDSP
jgi:peptide/nickel transport system permease protein